MLHINHKLSSFFILLLLLFCNTVFADKGRRSHFIYHGPGVAALGLAETFTSFGDDVSVCYYNPSLLAGFSASYISASHTFLYDSARYDFMGFSYLLEHSAFAFCGTQLYRDNIEVRRTITDDPEYTKNSQLLLTGSYALKVDSLDTSIGTSINLLNYTLYEYSAYGLSLDVGFCRKLISLGNPLAKSFLVDTGINFKNIINTPVKLDTTKEKIPFMLKWGVSARLTLFPRYNKSEDTLSYDELIFGTDVSYYENSYKPSACLSYEFLDKFFVRGGYNGFLSLGGGFKLGSFKFDYAYSNKGFTSFHSIGSSYVFNEVLKQPVASSFTEEFQKVYKKAGRLYIRYVRDAERLAELKKYDDTIPLLKKAIVLRPKDNSEAVSLLDVYSNIIVSNKTNDIVTKANKNKDADKLNSYSLLIQAFDGNPLNQNIVLLLNSLYWDMGDSEKSEADKLRSEYIKSLADKVNLYTEKNKFQQAGIVLGKLKRFAPGSNISLELNSNFMDKKELYVYKLASQGIESMKTEDFVKAYHLFNEAHQLKPDDTSFKDQMELAKKKYIKLRKLSMEDKVYSLKLYYLAAVEYASGGNPVGKYNQLISFNALHEYLPLIEEVIKRKE